jgi:hypothetical protein
VHLDPGTSDPWRDRLMNHVKLRFGRNLSSAIDPQLRRTDLSGPARLGLLRMAGYISDPSLAETIEISWNADGNRQSHLADYLVTASYCCGDQPERILAPICDAWAALPSKAENENEPSAREDLAAHGVRFAFQRRPPLRAIKYLIKRANDEELRWPITYLLHEVDDPDVLEFIACELADTTISLEGSGRSSTFVITAPDRWSRHVEYGEKPMSKASKERLARLWSAPESGEHLRQQAFRLWAASQADGDIEILRRIEPDNSLWNKALFARLIRGDHLAIPAAEQKLLTNNESYWWQAGRYLWSARLTEALDQSLTRRRAEVERSWQQKERDVDWITSEMITRLPILTAESLLVKHWDHLRFSPNFIHAALHTATPVLAPLIANTMTECPDPSGALEHVDHHYGIGHRGRGVSRIAQVESLVPYLHLLSELAVLHFWDACNAQGWLTFRRTHLDPLLKNPRYSEFLTEDGMFASLDEQIERNHTRSIDWWVERFMKAGASIDEIMSILGKWLTSRSTMPAFTSVAEVVAQFGHRSHLSILNPQTVDPTDMAVDIVRDAEFTVRRRTLL